MFVKGVGMTKFGFQEEPSRDMIYESVMEALNDAKMSMQEIDVVVVSSIEMISNGERQKHSASMISSLLQIKAPILDVPAGCAGGGTALWTAIKLLKNSSHKNILVIGFDKIVATTTKIITDEILRGGERIYEQTEGMIFPAQNALVAQQYMLKYGATSDDFALVAYKNHQNAFLNPKARFYKKEVTLKQIRKSPMVASPLRLFDCSLSVNGAAAAVITKDETDIKIMGSSLFVDRLSTFESEDMTSWQASVLAAGESYKQAGVSPNDIDVVEVHDAFTPVELISYEDLGFCKRGEGKNMIRKEITNLNGKLPVNTSGGLKAKGHPISATGIAQIYELVKQMRREAGDRQVSNANIALAQNIGGAGSSISVHILGKV